jgi:hypothetical protein
MHQARCRKCRIHYDWGMKANFPRKTKHGDRACCPECRAPLSLTTHLCKDRVSLNPPLYFPPGEIPKLSLSDGHDYLR